LDLAGGAQYDKWDADRIIGEANNGGDLIDRCYARSAEYFL